MELHNFGLTRLPAAEHRTICDILIKHEYKYSIETLSLDAKNTQFTCNTPLDKKYHHYFYAILLEL